jgi:hypothetical protein
MTKFRQPLLITRAISADFETEHLTKITTCVTVTRERTKASRGFATVCAIMFICWQLKIGR